MAENSKIEWCDHTWSPWLGCTKVSPACDFCYAESWARRAGSPELWQGQRRRTSAEYWQKPIKWDKEAAASGQRLRIFPSLCDPFDNQIDSRWRNDLWHRIEQTPHLDWLLLTKRPQNIAKMLPDPETGVKPWGKGWPNVWLGTTAEDQRRAQQNIPILLTIPAAIRFASLEPLLGRIDLTNLYREGSCRDALAGTDYMPGAGSISSQTWRNLSKLDWVIAGGESGPQARPMHPDWPLSIRDQCVAAGVPFHFKQWGEWFPDVLGFNAATLTVDGVRMARLGKKRAGRRLGGVEHNGMPQGAAE